MLQIPSLASQQARVDKSDLRRVYDIPLTDSNQTNFSMELHFLEDNIDRML